MFIQPQITWILVIFELIGINTKYHPIKFQDALDKYEYQIANGSSSLICFSTLKLDTRLMLVLYSKKTAAVVLKRYIIKADKN